MAIRCEILVLLFAALSVSSAAPRSNFVCEACQAYASSVLRQLNAAAASKDGRDLRAAIARDLGSDSLKASAGLGTAELQSRCLRFLDADARSLEKYVASSQGVATWEQVFGELCEERLRCSPAFKRWGSVQAVDAVGAQSRSEVVLEQDSGTNGTSMDVTQPVTLQGGYPVDPLKPLCTEREDTYADLASTRIVAVVFVGRQDRLRILFRYLRRDLRQNGGVVDKVILALWYVTAKDLEFAKKFAEGFSSRVEIRDFTEQRWGPAREGAEPLTNRMVKLYNSLDEEGTVYVKIDDDVVYIAAHSIAEIVREKLRHRCLFVSANVVNHNIMSALHQDRGAHRGFRPPEELLKNPSLKLAWLKTDELNFSPQFRIERAPAAQCVVGRWDCAALVHESFLDRAKENTLCAFDFGWYDFNRAGYREHTYKHGSVSINKQYLSQGARWSINFFAFTVDDLRGANWTAVYGKGDDEEEFTGPHSERKDRHSCAVGAALVVHFSYDSQEEGLLSYTSLLRRYDKLSQKQTRLRP